MGNIFSFDDESENGASDEKRVKKHGGQDVEENSDNNSFFGFTFSSDEEGCDGESPTKKVHFDENSIPVVTGRKTAKTRRRRGTSRAGKTKSRRF